MRRHLRGLVSKRQTPKLLELQLMRRSNDKGPVLDKVVRASQ